MVRIWALHTKNARAIARKADLRSTSEDVSLSRPVTLIDAFALVGDEALATTDHFFPIPGAYQWVIDLSPYEKIRAFGSTEFIFYIDGSLEGADSSQYGTLGALPDYGRITGIYDEPGHPYDGDGWELGGSWYELGLGPAPRASTWIIIPEEHRTKVRMMAVSAAGIWIPAVTDFKPNHPFNFVVQAI
jgi:hypothetical protein